MADICSLTSYIASNLPRITALRKHIHAHPELSFQECNTASHLISFFQSLPNPPTEIVKGIAGTGFLAIFDFNTKENKSNKTIVFRSELDAVKVEEKNEFDHISTNVGVSHKCGHDGHMAILAGLSLVVSDLYKPESGRVVLLFQPAEETGEGAERMVAAVHPVLDSILKDENTTIYALHNVPGFPSGSIVLPRGKSFASASKGLHVKLEGCTCHASQPHLGKNPTMAMCNIIQSLYAIPSLHVPYDQKAIVTIVGARSGEKAFGVSAGEAEVMATLRSTTDSTMKILCNQASLLVHGIASTYGLKCSISYEDEFAATINNPVSVDEVRTAAEQCGFDTFWMDEAFPWSEDFGVFLQKTKGAMFGLGMGETHQPLHGEWYDFSDSELQKGILMFSIILQNYWKGVSA